MGFFDKWRRKPVPRNDDLQNTLTGLGVSGYDKRLGASIGFSLISQEVAETMWRGDDTIARLVEGVPNEMLREGFIPVVQGDKNLSEELENEHRRLDVVEKFREALHFARAYGGGGILIGVNGGRDDLSLPLDEGRVESVDFLNVFSPRELFPTLWFADMTGPRYGEVAQYMLVPRDRPIGDQPVPQLLMPKVHESRLIRFEGAKTSRGSLLRNVQRGWGDSILVRALQVIMDFQSAFAGVGVLLQDFAVPTLKITNLAQLLAMQSQSPSSSPVSVMNRVKTMELARSLYRAVVIDKEEEYKRESVNVAGLADLLDKMMLRLAQVAGMPVSLLFGQAPAGLNATGDSDIRWFYDHIRSKQEQTLRSPLERLTRLLLRAKKGPARGKEPDNWDINFNPLWQLTDKEKADARLAQAQADKIYIEAQVATPQEIAMARFGGDAYSFETHIDAELREELLDDEDLQLKELGLAESADGGLMPKEDVPPEPPEVQNPVTPPSPKGQSVPSGNEDVPQVIKK